MTNSHDGRVAVVTGSAQGIGQTISLALAQRGAKVVLVDLRHSDETSRLISDAGGECLSVQADVTAQDEWNRIAGLALDAFGGIDILVNNAGIFPAVPFSDLDEDLWRRTFAVNLDAHFYSAKTIVPMMKCKGWGRIVNVSSNSIGFAVPQLSHYISSKMAVIGFVRGLANEVGEFGVTVNALLPGLTDTPGTKFIPDEAKGVAVMSQAIRRLSVPDDLSGAAAFLTSDDAAFITGQALVVDGGAYRAG